eukprot:c26680_g1_i1 orf=956-1201(+)
MLPDGLQINAVQHTSEYQSYGCLERPDKSAYRRLAGMPATVAPRRKYLSLSSMYLRSSPNGGVIPLDWMKSNSFKGRQKQL